MVCCLLMFSHLYEETTGHMRQFTLSQNALSGNLKCIFIYVSEIQIWSMPPIYFPIDASVLWLAWLSLPHVRLLKQFPLCVSEFNDQIEKLQGCSLENITVWEIVWEDLFALMLTPKCIVSLITMTCFTSDNKTITHFLLSKLTSLKKAF